MKVVVSVIVIKDKKILMVQEAHEACRGQWNFPAGHLDEGENIFDAAIREAKEETGYDVELKDFVTLQNLLLTNLENTKLRHLFHVVFTAEVKGGKIAYDKNEIMDVQWLDIDKVLAMNSDELRSCEARKESIKAVLADRVFPLDVVKNFEYVEKLKS